MVELTSSRVDKASSKAAFAPKFKPRTRPSPNESSSQRKTVTIAPTVTIVPPPSQSSQKESAVVAVHEEPLVDEPPPAVPIVAPARPPILPIGASRTAIAVPSSAPKVVSSRTTSISTPVNPSIPPSNATPSSSINSLLANRDEEAANVLSLRTLIKSKFEDGKISKFEELRRSQIAEQRKKRKLDRAVKGHPEKIEKASAERQLEQSSSQEDQDETSTVVDDNGSEKPQSTQPEQSPLRTSGPQLRLVNGQMVLDEASLVVEGPAGPKEGDLQRIEEGQLRYISAASFRSRPMSGRIKWNEPMTQRFYEGLSYFGTDFGLISLLFPGLTRHQIKLKFNAEERARGAQVNEALMNRRIPDQSVKDRMRGLLTKKLEVSEVQLPLPQPKKTKTGTSASSYSAPGQPGRALDTVEEEDESGAEVDVPAPAAGPSVVDQAIQETNDRAFEEAMQTITSAKPSAASGPSVIKPKVAVRSRPRKKPVLAPAPPPPTSDSMEE